MSYFALGDIQAHSWANYGSVGPDGINDRLMDVIYELRRIRKFAKERNVTHLFILGDVFQERGKLDIVVLNMMYRELWAYRKAGIKVIIIVGNHDRHPVGNFHSLEVFQDIAIVCDKPTRYDFSGIRVLAIPFLPESKEIVQQLKKYGDNAHLILMHVAVKKIKLPSGEEWDEGIPLKAIPKGPFTLMGHYHRRMKLRKRVWYVGSLLQCDFGDTGQEKMFAEWTGKKLIWHKTQGPEFLHVQADKFKTLKKFEPAFYKGNFIKVSWTGPFEEIGKIRSWLYDDMKVRVAEVEPMLHTTDTIQELKGTTSERLDAVLRKYVKKNSPEEYRDSLLRIGQELLNDVVE